LVLFVTSIALYILGPSEKIWFLNQAPSWDKLIYNTLLFPTNYIFEPLVITPILPHPIVPPAWSLATELHFYLFLPLLFSISKRLFGIILAICLGIQLSSFFINSLTFSANSFGYRYIIGVLPIFLMGFLFAEPKNTPSKYIVWLIYCSLLSLYLLDYVSIESQRAKEVLIGATMSLPLFKLATSIKAQHLVNKRLDQNIGDFSYPMFLTHCFTFYLLEKIFSIHPDFTWFYIFTVILISLFLSIPLTLIQKEIQNYRFIRRGFDSTRPS
jgi:peptidoglycan/LPS O-acetylase OafA/YrhL